MVQSRILDLVVQYEEAQEHGRPRTPEHLCSDCTELLDELKRALYRLGIVDRELGADTWTLPPSDTTLPCIPGYELHEVLGEGGMGIVYRVKDRVFRRSLAVKVLAAKHKENADLKRRFLEEAQLMGQLQHPGIPPVHELGAMSDGRPYLAMKLIRGRSLAALLKERAQPAQDQPRLVGIFEQVCRTVAYSHAQGIIHRDLKPGNVMVGAFGEVQVMDWGLAKVLGAPASAVTEAPQASVISTVRSEEPDAATQPGLAMGTPAYMAPEQGAARRPSSTPAATSSAWRDPVRNAHRRAALWTRQIA